MKSMTLDEAETKRQKAVEFLRRIGRDDDVDRFADMNAREYAEHKGAQLLENPNVKRRLKIMPQGKSKAELENELDEANDYIEELESKLDDIVGIASDEEEEAEEGDDQD